MNRLLKKQYPDLCAFLDRGVQLAIDNKGMYVQDTDGYLWADCGRYDSLDSAFRKLSEFLSEYYRDLDNRAEVTIDLIDFIKTHNVSCIPNKTPKSDVESILGIPTDYMIASEKSHSWYRKSHLWKYGELEVYFDTNDCINYCSFKNLDAISYHYPIRRIRFDVHYDYGTIPNIFEFREILEKHGIKSIIQAPAQRDENCCRLLCENEVWVYFEEEQTGSMESSVINSVNCGASLIGWEDI